MSGHSFWIRACLGCRSTWTIARWSSHENLMQLRSDNFRNLMQWFDLILWSNLVTLRADLHRFCRQTKLLDPLQKSIIFHYNESDQWCFPSGKINLDLCSFSPYHHNITDNWNQGRSTRIILKGHWLRQVSHGNFDAISAMDFYPQLRSWSRPSIF